MMKNRVWMRSGLRLLRLLALAPLAAAAADLTVEVQGALPDGGTVRMALAQQAAQFPAGKPFRGMETPPGVPAVIRDVPPGRYALVAYQDRNGNGKLDRGLFNVPSEPYGFSQDARGNGGPPEFRDAAFELGAAGSHIKVKLR